MPLKINCLYFDTSAVEDMKVAIKAIVAEKFDAKKDALFPSVYHEIYQAGIEIDAESVAVMYNELFGNREEKGLSTPAEVEAYVGMNIDNLVKDVRDEVLGETEPLPEKKQGAVSAEQENAMWLTRLFKKSIEGTVGRESSDIVKLKELVSSAARALMPKTKKGDNISSIFEPIDKFFQGEEVAFATLDGGFNTLRTLWSETQKRVDEMRERITQTMDDEEALMFKEKWDKYMETFRNASYDIMLGKGEQNKLLNKTLPQLRIDGMPIVDVNGNTKWSTLIEHDDPETIGVNIAKLYREGVTDEFGETKKYTPEQAERIGKYLENIYRTKLAEKKQQKLGLNRASNQSAKNLISDFIKDMGFFNLVKDKSGKLLLTQSDWKNALESMKKAASGNGLTLPIQQLREFLKAKVNEDGERKYNDYQIDLVVNEFESIVAAKILPASATPNELDRLVALTTLNGGRAFNETTQNALNKLVGLPDLSVETLGRLRVLGEATQKILNGGNLVSSSTSPDPSINVGAWAFQNLAQIDRQIKYLLRQHKVSASGFQRVASGVADVMITAANSKLINPANIGENILTGMATNPAETIAMVISNPEFYKYIGQSQQAYWEGFLSHVSGGVANDIINDENINTDIQSGERLRIRKFADGMRRGKKSAAYTLMQTPQYAVSVATRTIMNGFDAGVNQGLTYKAVVQAMYSTFLTMHGGNTQLAAKSVAEALNISKEDMAELDRVNAEQKKILNEAGIYPTAADLALNKQEMKMAFYERALVNASKGQDGKAGFSAARAHDIMKSVVEGATDKAKSLGGKKEMPISWFSFHTKLIYYGAMMATIPQKAAYRQMEKYEKEGKLDSAAGMKLIGAAFQVSLGLFVGGAAKFAALGLTATPFGFINYFDFKRQAKQLRDDKGANDVTSAEPGDIRKYAEVHGMIRTAAVRAALGSFAIAAFVISKMTEDDEDKKDSFIQNLMKTKSGRRLLQKYLPQGIMIAASVMYDSYDYRGNKMSWFASLNEVMKNMFTQVEYGKFSDKLNRAKDGEEGFRLFFEEYIAPMTPTYNFNQIEQIHRFKTTVSSGFDRKKIGEVERQEDVARDIYKEAESIVDIIGRNSAIDLGRRILSTDKKDKVNRFAKASSY